MTSSVESGLILCAQRKSRYTDVMRVDENERKENITYNDGKAPQHI